jgi:hypothetical protein
MDDISDTVNAVYSFAFLEDDIVSAMYSFAFYIREYISSLLFSFKIKEILTLIHIIGL